MSWLRRTKGRFQSLMVSGGDARRSIVPARVIPKALAGAASRAVSPEATYPGNAGFVTH